jgi:hypothetical protein
VIPEIELQTLFMDVDRKKKRSKGITLTAAQWRKVMQASDYIDEKLEKLRKINIHKIERKKRVSSEIRRTMLKNNITN